VPSAIRIEPYRDDWPRVFSLEREALAPILAPWLHGPIEHVGSTAVPGLAAKPIVDIMAGVESLEASRDALPKLAPLGYRYAPYREDAMHWLCKPGPDLRTHHLHLVPFGSSLWKDRIAFRDRLRADARIAREYAALKHELALRHPDDREAYTGAKGPFIERVLRGANVEVPMRPVAGDGFALEPQTAAHAQAMFAVLGDPAIYEYENAPPASLAWLRDRYARLESRRSPDGTEQWLNWVIRLPDGTLAGYVQATVHADGHGAIAYELASAHWGRGLARRAVEAMMLELRDNYGVCFLQAVSKEANHRSRRLLVRLGFSLVTQESRLRGLEPGEVLMERGLSPAIASGRRDFRA
jgi:GrpB-like predicted nucleotidyltransferase (UPF0157 family)/L-amino acid N-acyltransferase YncA